MNVNEVGKLSSIAKVEFYSGQIHIKGFEELCIFSSSYKQVSRS